MHEMPGSIPAGCLRRLVGARMRDFEPALVCQDDHFRHEAFLHPSKIS
jgi:hypothetical protein